MNKTYRCNNLPNYFVIKKLDLTEIFDKAKEKIILEISNIEKIYVYLYGSNKILLSDENVTITEIELQIHEYYVTSNVNGRQAYVT